MWDAAFVARGTPHASFTNEAAYTPPVREELLNKFEEYGPGWRMERIVKSHAAGGVKKTIQPWSIHVGEGYATLDNVEKAFGALETYITKVQVKDDKYKALIADREKQMRPRNCAQLRACLKDVLTSLSKLHQVNIVHRDIGWDNVVYVPSPRNTWLLIDYETVWEANVKPRCPLKVFDYAGVLEADGTYSKMSDLKLVGKLLDTVDCRLEEDLLEFRLKLGSRHFTDATFALSYLTRFLEL